MDTDIVCTHSAVILQHLWSDLHHFCSDLHQFCSDLHDPWISPCNLCINMQKHILFYSIILYYNMYQMKTVQGYLHITTTPGAGPSCPHLSPCRHPRMNLLASGNLKNHVWLVELHLYMLTPTSKSYYGGAWIHLEEPLGPILEVFPGAPTGSIFINVAVGLAGPCIDCWCDLVWTSPDFGGLWPGPV